MRKPNLNHIVAGLRKLTLSQLKAVSTEVAALEAQSGATAVVEGRFAAGATCPHCHCQRVYRHGQANGLQRYRCRACLRTFNAVSGTPLSGLHKREKWLGQATALHDGRTLRTVAKELGIHIGTAHRWRHRFLALPQALQPEALAGIAEADETMFLRLRKSVQIWRHKMASEIGGDVNDKGATKAPLSSWVEEDQNGGSVVPTSCKVTRSLRSGSSSVSS